MSSISNNKRITAITIPGTHDSMALYNGFTLMFAKCQAWSLPNQLLAGIRYLDLRVKVDLHIVHGPVDQRITFPQVLHHVQDFLSQHQTETVLIRMKPEGSEKNDVQKQVENVIKGKENIWTNENIPTMGEARGKVILVQKNEFTLGIKTFNTDQPNDYKVSSIENKKIKIAQHLTEAGKKCAEGSNEVIVSYSSGTGGPHCNLIRSPEKVARNIDPWLSEHLNGLHGPCYGVIAMDFPGIDLIEKIIKINYTITAKDHIIKETTPKKKN
ncbi:hypothetical protein ACEWY4_000866 [Coilia grayii]|uniref:Phosphatidylinositol-specific phospholipase C X domain-containing protein n=1 Tax=Coilia grayii TaxID=363190 RepID=A0ABD1KZ66_9TELE